MALMVVGDNAVAADGLLVHLAVQIRRLMGEQAKPSIYHQKSHTHLIRCTAKKLIASCIHPYCHPPDRITMPVVIHHLVAVVAAVIAGYHFHWFRLMLRRCCLLSSGSRGARGGKEP